MNSSLTCSLLLFLLVSITGVFAQDTFHKTYQGIEHEETFYFPPKAHAIPGNDGYVIVSQDGNRNSGYNTALLSFDACDQLRWSKKLNNVTPQDIALLSKDIQVLGFLSADKRMILTHLDSNGKVISSKHFSAKNDPNARGLFPYQVEALEDGNYYISGSMDNNHEYFIVRFDKASNMVWSKIYEFPEIDVSYCHTLALKDGGLLIWYNRQGLTPNKPNFIVKIDKNGTVNWAHRYSKSLVTFNGRPVEVSDGYVFAALDQPQIGNIFSDYFLFKTDPNGNMLWTSDLFNAPTIGEFTYLENTNRFIVANWTIIGDPIYDRKCWITELNGDGKMLGQAVQTIEDSITMLFGGITPLYGSQFMITGIEGKGINQNLLFLRKVRNLYDLYQCGYSSVFNKKEKTKIDYNSFTVPTRDFQVYAFPSNESTTDIQLTESVVCSVEQPFSIGEEDTTLCAFQTVTLQPHKNYAFYEWSTGATTPSITVTEPGTYWLNAGYDCQVFSDTFRVNYHPEPEFSFTVEPKEATPLDAISFSSGSKGEYELLWEIGNNITRKESHFLYTFNENGNHPIRYSITDQYICTYSDTTSVNIRYSKLFIPNSFTPNGDGINDFFAPRGFGINTYRISIFNRWGDLVFEGENIPWNGANNTTDNYIYRIEVVDDFGEITRLTGKLNLMK